MKSLPNIIESFMYVLGKIGVEEFPILFLHPLNKPSMTTDLSLANQIKF